MNDLIIPTKMNEVFPTLSEGLKRAWKIIQQINSFEDIERRFLMGAGLSPNTYRSYLTSVRQLYEFSGGLNPLQIDCSWIEQFYDHLIKNGVDRNTACLRIQGLKRFFAGIRNVLPIYTSPFEIMSESLRRKLSRTKKGNRTKKALLKGELLSLLAWLKEDKSVKGLSNYALVLTLFTSALRASELCQLCWKNLDHIEGKYIASFTGKGQVDAEQQIDWEAIEATKLAFYKQFGRLPGPGDCFFYSLESYSGKIPAIMTPAVLWLRIRDIGLAAREAGIIKRDIIFSPHLFRRSSATLLFKEKMDLKSLQNHTRHNSVDVLLKHYVDSSENSEPFFDKILQRKGA